MTVSEKVLIYDQSILIAAPGEPDCTDLPDRLAPAVPFRLPIQTLSLSTVTSIAVFS